ncbi:MAG: ATP-dependent RNA helicase HrpA [Acidimicrobiia bacterium]
MASTPSDLRARLNGLTPGDRQRFRRRLSGADRIPDPERRDQVLAVIRGEIDAARQKLERRRAAAPKKLAYPEELPITGRRRELLDTIRDHQVVIVAGETGSGKSTQLPKLCLELGRGVEGMIGHTQPRRIAARSIAERVAEELGTTVGGLVGYTVRFSDQVGDATLVKVMTDGILLAEIHRDRRLSRYDTIIIDEAHERSLNIDFLLGYLKTLLPKRPDLKLIITSATIDTERFSEHFHDAPVVEVSGRTYPVELRYRPLDDPTAPEPRDQPQGICDAVAELAEEGSGDILVFCSGEREIRDAADALGELGLRHTEVLPLYGRLSAAEQHRVFQPHRGRRVVLATNVAETSLTVPGIRSVIDAGTARISRYSRRTKVQRLPIEPVSRASADQRAGRCGRLGSGICIRLYSEDDYNARPEFTEPEIRRTNLASVILAMAARDLGEIETFPFLDPPDARTVRDGIALLAELGAVDPAQQGTGRWLTKLGRQLADFPLDLRLARMIIEAGRNDCLKEVLVIAAALAIQDPRERPVEKRPHADQLHARFRDEASDFLSWLRLWEYLGDERRARTSNQFRRMCRDELLNYRRVREWQDIHAQLRDVAREQGFTFNRQPASPEVIHRTLLAGLLSNIGHKDPEGFEYRGSRGARFAINPGSTLFKRSPEWVMAAELVDTSRLWARGVAAVDPEWVEEIGAHLVKRSYSDPWWDRERGTSMARETVTLYGLPLQTDRTVQYGRVDQAEARELFIYGALVSGEWETEHAFMRRNRAKIAEVHELEARRRRVDLLVDDEVMFRFFDQRLPDDITSVRHFDRWWKEARGRDPYQLDLSLDLLIDPAADPVDTEAFPEVWAHGDLALPLTYEFDPGSPTDGITVDVPIQDLDRVDPAVFEWHVPGLREELITALIRSLPKQIRKRFSPVPNTVRVLLDGLDPDDGGLLRYLRRELSLIGGAPVPVDAFDLTRLPSHLQPTFRVVGADNQVFAEGNDLAALKTTLQEQARATMTATGHELEQTGLTAWSIGELPRVVEVGGAAHSVRTYPALVDEGASVGVRLLATPAEQAEAMWTGTRRLLLLNLPAAGRLLRPLLTNEAAAAVKGGPYEGPAEWAQDCLTCAVDRVMGQVDAPVWDGVAFEALLGAMRDNLDASLNAVAEASLHILGNLRLVRIALARVPDKFANSVADVEEQVDRLIYPGFVAGVGAGRLADVHRYLQAIERRLERLPENGERDRQKMAAVRKLEAEHDRLREAQPDSASLLEVAWMLQELRVSVFAQALGTRGKVSEKRIVEAMVRAMNE